jgi:glycosyltransferase involved in cell wall biosynthesis
MIKVLHFIAGDFTGGAAKGALLLHESLLKLGINSIVISNSENYSNDKSIKYLSKNIYFKYKFKFYRFIARLPLFFYSTKSHKLQFSTGIDGIDVTKLYDYNNADVIHFHWINGLVNLSSIKKIQKPIIWTIRDMWPITGGCHVSLVDNELCDRYNVGCGKCPLLNSSNYSDLSSYIFQNKINIFNLKSLTIVGISKWITNLASKSTIYKFSNFHHIPNNIDTNTFKPMDRSISRAILNLNIDEDFKVISIGAHDLSMRHKGFYEFKESLKFLDTKKIIFLFFGLIDNIDLDDLNIKYFSFGYIADNEILRYIYCSSDIFLAPSLIESFGKTLAEALSCQIPVVCFDSSGTSDIVKHKFTGYKARSYDPEDLANGIKWLLGLNKINHLEIAFNSRKWVLEQYDSKVIANKYLKLYKQIIKN